jgi:delta-aminolevulinic acid dehydratase/porphobilinogen synthase
LIDLKLSRLLTVKIVDHGVDDVDVPIHINLNRIFRIRRNSEDSVLQYQVSGEVVGLVAAVGAGWHQI